MTIDEVKEKIKNKEYPHVARLSEPYLTRLSELTLVVNDITYTAKIKDGVNVQGFMIYSSGLGIPVYEDLEKKNNGEFNGKSKLKESTDKARKWIDELEIAIAEIVNDNPIKKAIDRLNWQVHYDTTGVRTDLSTKLAEFSQFEVTEDKPAVDMFETTVVAKTLTTTITDAAQEISVGSGGSSGGNLYKIAQNIYTLEQTMNRTLGTINTTFTTYDGNMKSYLIGSNGSSIYGIINTTNTSIKTCLTGGDSTKNIYSILENTSNKICVNASNGNPQQTMWDALIGTNAYSISAALRESDPEDSENTPKCVAKEINTGCTDIANKTETRTQTEDAAFGEIEGRIGEPGEDESVWDTVKNINGGVAIRSIEPTSVDDGQGNLTTEPAQSLWHYASRIGYAENDQPHTTLFSQIGWDPTEDEYKNQRTLTYSILHDVGTMNTAHLYSGQSSSMMYKVNATNTTVNTMNTTIGPQGNTNTIWGMVDVIYNR